MIDELKHECGIAFLKLKEDPQYYYNNYKDTRYVLNKIFSLIKSQLNRGQDGAGIANIKLDLEPGNRYISRKRSIKQNAFGKLYKKISQYFEEAEERAKKEKIDFFGDKYSNWFKKNFPFSGEIWLGHLRYGTSGSNFIENCHPFFRQSNWRSKNLIVAGNFNMTNVDTLFNVLVNEGQHPKEKVDTVTVMEKIGYFLDVEIDKIYLELRKNLNDKIEITKKLEKLLEEKNIEEVLKQSFKNLDGGYVIVGLIGSGLSFVVRDPNGIRPVYYYENDGFISVVSEKQALFSNFNCKNEEIKEIKPGHALIIPKNGEIREVAIIENISKEKKSCSFERIYFSRGTDSEIYNERKTLGKCLLPQVLEKISPNKIYPPNLKKTVFSYIPNTSETAFLGLMEEMDKFLTDKILEKQREEKISEFTFEHMVALRPRIEKVIVKDEKKRTFISNNKGRNEMVKNSYSIIHNVINVKEPIKDDILNHVILNKEKEATDLRDTLVILDDSIVRGNTLKQSIIPLLVLLNPKKIIFVSSAPQIRYPDYYGIDMSTFSELIAFNAAIKLVQENHPQILDELKQKCDETKNDIEKENYVKKIYEPFTNEQISSKIAELVTPQDVKIPIEIVFQTIDNLHNAIPNHKGDWYFSGNYPTPGGNKLVNRSFLNFMMGKNDRASDF